VVDWSAPVDDYCERTGPGLLSEPLNFITNAAFLVAAVVAYVRYRRTGVRDRAIEAMLALMVAIAIGSGLFHSIATRWAMVADVAPIGVLVLVYLAYFCDRVLGLPGRATAAAVGGMVALTAATALVPRAWLNHSQTYVPTLITMIAMAAVTWDGVGRRVAVAAALFAASLTLRSVDQAVCGAVPIGTHFLWHTLNGVLLYVLMAIVIDAQARRRPA
jgi:hypothetical protein